MSHPALHTPGTPIERPWPEPARPWSVTMAWEDLLFLHWRVDARALAAHIPPGLELETFDGSAWLAVVPFRMARTRFRWMPKVPTTHAFPELNVRTYVRARSRDGALRPGVWFFSLDAASRLAVEGARLTFGLPYFAARMRCETREGRVSYASERVDRRGPAARFEASWRVAGEHARAVPGTLEHWLVERYCLYAMRRGRIVCGEVAHKPWEVAPVDLRIESCDMTRLVDCETRGAPVSALAARAVEVAAWSPLAV